MAKIIITINPDTRTAKVEAEGYSGGACLKATEPYEKDLGEQEGDRIMKSDACSVSADGLINVGE